MLHLHMFGLFLYFSTSERNIQNQQTLHYKKLHLFNHQTGWRLIFRQLMNQIRVCFMSEARPGFWMPQQPPELRRLLWIPVWVRLAVTFTHVVSSQKVCLTWTLITERWLWKQTETCVFIHISNLMVVFVEDPETNCAEVMLWVTTLRYQKWT